MLTGSGAADEGGGSGLHAQPYAFTTDGTNYSAYQASAVYVATGKTASTGYSCNWRVRDAAAFVGLHETLLDKSPFELSGGQKRRVAIAGVIAMEPKVLVLDEPTAGLDPQGRDAILAQIQAYHRAKGAAVVLVSHSMEEIARNVDRIVVLSDGKVYMEGTPKQVFARAHELEQVGLDVPQVTKVAAALKARGLDIDTAVYTVEALEQKLLTLRGGASPC